jgi:hypothetical protein
MAVDLWFGLIVLLFFGTFAVLAALCDRIEKMYSKKWRKK